MSLQMAIHRKDGYQLQVGWYAIALTSGPNNSGSGCGPELFKFMAVSKLVPETVGCLGTNSESKPMGHTVCHIVSCTAFPLGSF